MRPNKDVWYWYENENMTESKAFDQKLKILKISETLESLCNHLASNNLSVVNCWTFMWSVL